jgi:hypothetical protein
MSHETLGSFHDFATVLTAERSGRPKIRVLAFSVGLLVLTPMASVALELGEATIRSGLGQPLVVEIPYRLAGDEQLAPTCINLVPATRSTMHCRRIRASATSRSRERTSKYSEPAAFSSR